MGTQALTVIAGGGSLELQSSAFMPVMKMAQAIERYNAVLQFTQTIMKDGKDYGKVPGVDKPSLLKPGAEKLCSFFGLSPRFVVVEKQERWDGDEPFFYYWYKCQLYRGESFIAEGEGSCNSHESKYRYRWLPEALVPVGLDLKRLRSRGGRRTLFEPNFALDKKETGGQYGKPLDHWQRFEDAIAAGTARRAEKQAKSGKTMAGWEIDVDETQFQVPNPDVADQVNTIQKMAQKRAQIAATLIACNASEYYTQDVEDLAVIDVTPLAATRHADPLPEEEPVEFSMGWVQKSFVNATTVTDEIKRIKALCEEIDGSDSNYREVLAAYKVSKPADIKTLTAGHKVIAALYDYLRKRKEQMEAEPEPESAPVITDDDLPEALRGPIRA